MYKEIYDVVCDPQSKALDTLARMALREAAIPVCTGSDDTRDAWIVVEPDGSLDVRLLGTAEHVPGTSALARVRHWCAWDCIDSRSTVDDMIPSCPAAQAALIAAADAALDRVDWSDPEDVTHDVVRYMETRTWRAALDWLDDAGYEAVAEPLGEAYIEWAAEDADNDEYIQGIVDEAMDELRRLAAGEEGDDDE